MPFAELQRKRWLLELVSLFIHFYSIPKGKRNQNWLNYKRMGETRDQMKFTITLLYRHKQQIASVIVISLGVMQPSVVLLQPLSPEHRIGLF